ncbi:cytochrome c biogenesis protein ResB [Paraburkholderia sp. MM5482-R1]
MPARVEVNKPFEYDGVSIYQSSFQDGGSQMQMTAFPMSGPSAKPAPFGGTIGGSAPLSSATPLADGQTVEFTDFRAINVENISNGNGQNDARGVVAQHSLKEAFDERLGSGAKTSKPLDLHNVGPSVQYKIRGKDGQAREYNNYMLPVDVNGEKMFLAGMRLNPDDPFRYLRIPADSGGTLKEWMNLRATLEDPNQRAIAAHQFAQHSVPGSNAELQQHLEESALRVLTLFAGADSSMKMPNGETLGGFQAVAGFIDRSVPKGEQEKAAGLLLRMLEGVTWDLWQLSRQRLGEPAAPADADTSRFIQSSLNAISDSFLYGSPVYLQLDSFKQVQASVFQLTRAPGKKVVYLGSLLLVLGIFSMFYVRERRLWFWLKDTDHGTSVVMAMSSARKTLDFEKEFVQTRAAVSAALGAKLIEAADASPAGQAAAASASSQDSTR